MVSRTAVLGFLVVVLLATNGIVAYMYFGATDDTETPEGDQQPSVGDEMGSSEPASDSDPAGGETVQAPSWDTPVWTVNTTWMFRQQTPINTTIYERQVTTDNASVAGEPAYGVSRPDANFTTFYSKDTINPLLRDGSEQRIYQWPLEDGKSWSLRGQGGSIADVYAEWEENMTTPLGLYDGYKITADYNDRNMTEVYRYVDRFGWHLQIDTFRNGNWQQTIELIRYQPGQ